MKHRNANDVSRRKFLGQMSCAAVGSTAFYSTLLNLLMTSRVSAQTIPSGGNDYKALVCLFLTGGNDSFNMLVPRNSTEYAAYQASRGNLALAAEEILDIADPASGRAFGIHGAMTEFQELYNAGDLAFVCNTGTLVQPTTLEDYNQGRVKLPLGLFSHSDQLMHWQTSTPDHRGGIGWLGRAADILNSLNENGKISMNVSLAGANILQTGASLVPYAVTEQGAVTLASYNDNNPLPIFRESVDSLLDQEYQNVLQRTYARLNRDALSLGTEFNEALSTATPLSTQFPDTYFGRQLRMIARSISAREPLGMRRQSYLSYAWGWDHHDGLLASHGPMLGELSEAVGAFWTAMGELGLQDSVTLFSASDFGRTLTSNGDGSDHAWGGNQFVLGGGVNGGRLYGSYPDDLTLDGPLDTGRGRFIPTTSVDEYFAELALWLGAQHSDLSMMLPNLDRFYNIGNSGSPLGMFS